MNHHRFYHYSTLYDDFSLPRCTVHVIDKNAPPVEAKEVSEKTEKMEDEKPAEEPAPDYSDDEETPSQNGKEEDYTELRKTVKNRISAMLTREEWDQIIDRSALEEEENELFLPEPDYDGAKPSRPVGRAHTFNIGASAEKPNSPESKARQDLMREMMMNKKLGIDVLQKKSELQKEFTKRKQKDKAKDQEPPRRNSFELKLQEMADKKQKQQENGDTSAETSNTDEANLPEFLRVHSKIYKTKTSS